MQLQILKVILWARDPQFMPREVNFQPGMVNVISGASKTGKSSVIPIIDYCLGSDKCSIPVRTIRNACSWFGLVIQTSEGQKLLARREPDQQASSGEMFLLEGGELVIPITIPEKNTTVNAVKRMLDRLAGLSNLGFDPSESGNGFNARPSFRDLLAFSFQPQNIVANPDVLFFRADTNEHREKLRTIFPYVLGATSADLLAKQWELESLIKELKRKERELFAQVKASDSWRADLVNWVAEAHELGLISDANFRNYEEDELINILRSVVKKSSSDAGSPVAGIEASSLEYLALQREESDVAIALSIARRRLDQISSMKGGLGEYSSGLQGQRDRLGISRWLRDIGKDSQSSKCPICEGVMDDSHSKLDKMCDSLALIESSVKQITPAPAALDRELVLVKDELRSSDERLKAVRIQKRSYEARSKEAKAAKVLTSQIDRFLGRAEQALTLFVARTVEGNLQKEVDTLRDEISKLKVQISSENVKKRLDAALNKISNIMGRITSRLDAEQPDDPAKLDVKELTVRVGNEDGREDFLWEMGSGANWLSYHVSVTVALQLFFISRKETPVPSLLIYDQPSQVYFPRRLAKTEDSENESIKVKLPDEDIASIRRFFEVFGRATLNRSEKLQIIVLDHADSEVWGDLEGVTLVEEWRNSKKLVPIEWLKSKI